MSRLRPRPREGHHPRWTWSVTRSSMRPASSRPLDPTARLRLRALQRRRSRLSSLTRSGMSSPRWSSGSSTTCPPIEPGTRISCPSSTPASCRPARSWPPAGQLVRSASVQLRRPPSSARCLAPEKAARTLPPTMRRRISKRGVRSLAASPASARSSLSKSIWAGPNRPAARSGSGCWPRLLKASLLKAARSSARACPATSTPS